MMSGLTRTGLLLPALTLAGAIAFSFPAVAVAQASQGEKTDASADDVKPAGVGGVTVEAPRQPSKLEQIPPDKKAAFDEQAAKNEAWKRYRRSTPPLADGALGQSKDYPGLQSLLPDPAETSPAPGPIDLR